MKNIHSERTFKKSSFSNHPGLKNCVDVSISSKDILVTNLNTNDSQIVQFNHDEWNAFIKGVKNGEFDI